MLARLITCPSRKMCQKKFTCSEHEAAINKINLSELAGGLKEIFLLSCFFSTLTAQYQIRLLKFHCDDAIHFLKCAPFNLALHKGLIRSDACHWFRRCVLVKEKLPRMEEGYSSKKCDDSELVIWEDEMRLDFFS